MKKIRKMMLIITIGAVIVLSACTGNENSAGEDQSNGINTENVSNHFDDNHGNLNNPDIIPSETSDKTRTTNEYGTTYSGMGQDIYSSIGSSGIHQGGVSSYFESILEGQGITGIKVFVVDDSVILARNKEELTSHQYENTQRKLLSNTEGLSGKGDFKETEEGNQEESHDNLHQAQEQINEMFNGDVKILTVTDPKAVDLIEAIKENIMDSSYKEASKNLLILFNMAD